MKGGANTGASVSPTYAWEFRNGTGEATVYDWVNGVAATPSGTTSTSAGMEHSSSPGQFVALDDLIFGNNDSVTFEMYAKTTQVAQERLFDFTDGSASETNSYNGLTLRTDPSGTGIKFFMWNGADGYVGTDEITNVLTIGSFFHVVVSISTSNIILYVDGDQIDSADAVSYTHLRAHET